MPVWLENTQFLKELDESAKSILLSLKPQHVPRHTSLFRSGDEASCFLLVISGRAGVYLTGKSGRELLLYSVSPGETCVLTTLSILGGVPYSGEGIAETDLVAVMVPARQFEALMQSSAEFRQYVFKAFAGRLSDVMFLLEQVAFVRVEERLAGALLERADVNGIVNATHGELAVAIGSVREVVSRRLEALSSKGIVSVERGQIAICERAKLVELSSQK